MAELLSGSSQCLKSAGFRFLSSSSSSSSSSSCWVGNRHTIRLESQTFS